MPENKVAPDSTTMPAAAAVARLPPTAGARRPARPPVRRRQPARASWLVDQSRLVGHALGAFALFYSSMNWWFYRRLREDLERRDKKDEK